MRKDDIILRAIFKSLRCLFFCAHILLPAFFWLPCAEFVFSASAPTETTTSALFAERTAAANFLKNYTPPLGVRDSSSLTRRLLVVSENFPDLIYENREQTIKLINDVIAYTNYYDSLHSNLIEYTWIPLGNGREFSLKQAPVKNVNALAFSIEGDPVSIQSLSIKEIDGTSYSQDVNETITSKNPADAIIFLHEQSDIINITLHTNNTEDDGKVKLELGIAPEPEFAKQAILHLQTCIQALIAQETEKFLSHLYEATQALIKYRVLLSKKQD